MTQPFLCVPYLCSFFSFLLHVIIKHHQISWIQQQVSLNPAVRLMNSVSMPSSLVLLFLCWEFQNSQPHT